MTRNQRELKVEIDLNPENVREKIRTTKIEHRINWSVFATLDAGQIRKIDTALNEHYDNVPRMISQISKVHNEIIRSISND